MHRPDGSAHASGTPLQNNLAELWSLLNFLMPELFGSSDDFQQWFACAPSLADAGSDAALLSEEETLLVTNRLHQVLRPFILRRLKDSVAAELPQKVGHNMSYTTACKACVKPPDHACCAHKYVHANVLLAFDT